MGEKRTRTWERFYVFLVFLITIVCGCATITDFENHYTARDHLDRSELFFGQENFGRALQESEEALTLSPKKSPGDNALFMMGLIFAHHNNPEKSYEKAVGFFERLIVEFPESALKEQSEMWVTVLTEARKQEKPAPAPQKRVKRESPAEKHHRLGQELLARKDFDQALKEYQRALALSPRKPPGDEALFDMGLLFAYSDNPNRDYKTSVEFFRMLIDEFPQSRLIDQARAWVDVLQTIEKTKQVDIEIEEKKKELAR